MNVVVFLDKGKFPKLETKEYNGTQIVNIEGQWYYPNTVVFRRWFQGRCSQCARKYRRRTSCPNCGYTEKKCRKTAEEIIKGE